MNDGDATAGPPPPIANPDLFDHAQAELEFLDSFKTGRLPHAWLISGPLGVGKATLAYRIARFMLTQQNFVENSAGLFGNSIHKSNPTSLAVDITDPICRRIISGGHADFLCIQRSIDEKTGKKRREITVDEVRGVNSFFSKTPAEGGWRVIVIDSADEMNLNAANAVLKVLEEPPKQALLLLISNNPAKLLPTIRSRCRRLHLHSLPSNTISDFFRKYDNQITPEELKQLVELADGSIGRALEFSENGGLDIYREVDIILATLPELDIPRLHQLGDKLNRQKSSKVLEHTFDIINRWLGKIIKDLAINRSSSIDPWIEVWENTGSLLNQTKGLNLDPKQAILNTFIAIRNSSNHQKYKL
jgi:DNA polymerase-3 subunit delta'